MIYTPESGCDELGHKACLFQSSLGIPNVRLSNENRVHRSEQEGMTDGNLAFFAIPR